MPAAITSLAIQGVLQNSIAAASGQNQDDESRFQPFNADADGRQTSFDNSNTGGFIIRDQFVGAQVLIPPPIRDAFEVTKKFRPGFERFAENYVADGPEMLFAAEYVVNGNFIGTLLVWKKYFDSTHYEVFKKNLFQSGAEFERILFLGSQSLEEERSRLFSYIRDTLGFTDLLEDDIFLMLDTQVKVDRIYQYKVKASRVAKHPTDVDYDMILKSKGITNSTTLEVGSPATLFSFTEATFGSRDLAWTVSILNNFVRYFGRAAQTNALIGFIPNADLEENDNQFSFLTPKSFNDIMCIVLESIEIFGLRNTIAHLADLAGGLPEEWKIILIESIDAMGGNTFSFDRFKELSKSEFAVFDTVLEVTESADDVALRELSNLNLTLPVEQGSQEVASIEGISIIFRFVNDILLSVFYAQDDATLERLDEIKDEIAFRARVKVIEALEGGTVLLRDGQQLDLQFDDIKSESTGVAPVNFQLGMDTGDTSDNKDDIDDSQGNTTSAGVRVV